MMGIGLTTEICANAVRDFCNFMEDSSCFPIKERIRKASVLLARLHAAILDLPITKYPGRPEANIFNEVFPDILFEKYNSYWEFFDPYDKKSSCMASIQDDLGDIYHDLIDPLIAWDYIGTPAARKWAVYKWKSLYTSHGSEHATGALRALYEAGRNED